MSAGGGSGKEKTTVMNPTTEGPPWWFSQPCGRDECPTPTDPVTSADEGQTAHANRLEPIPKTPSDRSGPIELTARQEQVVKAWAADDRLWTTQETVEFNLRIVARMILADEGREAEPAPESKQPEPAGSPVQEVKVQRYDLITNYRCGGAIEEMERSDDGEWVRYDEMLAALRPHPPVQARCCSEPAPDRSGRTCDKPEGHDGPHWTYGGNTLTWPHPPVQEVIAEMRKQSRFGVPPRASKLDEWADRLETAIGSPLQESGPEQEKP